MAGGDDGLEFTGGKLSASVASDTVLGSVKIGEGLEVEADGTISIEALEPIDVIGGDGIDVTTTDDDVTINVDLAGGDDGLQLAGIGGDKLSASIATDLTLGSVKVAGMIAAADGLVDVDLAGGDDGLEFVGNGDSADKLSASIATDTVLGMSRLANANVEADGEISVNAPVVTSEIAPTDVEVNFLWFDSTSGRLWRRV